MLCTVWVFPFSARVGAILQNCKSCSGEPVCEQKMKRFVIENGEVTASEVAVASNARPTVQTSIRANT